MRIAVIGSGYVGLITAAGFASLGHDVVCVDVDEAKVGKINSKVPPIFEEGLPQLLSKVVPAKLTATLDLDSAVRSSEVVFVCVGTPSAADGSADLKYIVSASQGIGRAISGDSRYRVVIVKSTVVPGTTDGLVAFEIEKAGGKKAGADFGLAMAPEFLREGKAVEDFFSPDRVVIGTIDGRTRTVLEPLFSSFSCPHFWTAVKAAEMIKYASNSFLATKISFINELGNYCKTLGIDTYEVAEGMGLDSRIGRKFLNAGCGFGGSCFPKDVNALMHIMRRDGYEPRLLSAVMAVNDAQPQKMVEILGRRLKDLSGRKVAVLGLAFKPGTDDVRDTPATPIVASLLSKGAKVFAFDPEAMGNFKRAFPNISYCESAQSAVDSSDAVLLVTDWPAFESVDYGERAVVDGKNVLSKAARAKVKNYEGICW